MTVDDRILMCFLGILKETKISDSILDVDFSCDTYYKTLNKNCGSEIYNISSLKEMIKYINEFVGNEDVANCLTAKLFYDFYENDDTKENSSCKKSKTEEPIIEIPAYTYTL